MSGQDETTLLADVAAIGEIDAIPRLLEVVCRTTGLGFSAVARVTEDRWIACAVRDEIAFGLKPGGELRVETTICDQIRQTRQLVVIDDVAVSPTNCHHTTAERYGFKSYISVPIVLRNGRFFGTLCAIDPKPARLNTPSTLHMFALFAELIALHLDARERVVDLEAEVTARTAALAQSNAALEQALHQQASLEQARTAWLAALMNAHEDERRRVARELHDEMGQHLSLLTRGLADLDPHPDAGTAAQLRRLRDQVDQLGIGVRRLARDLRPAALDDLGLAAALASHIATWAEHTGICADFCSRNCERRLPSALESAVYRIVQEALTNVARHADASTVSVIVDGGDSMLTVVIEDNGRGFDPTTVDVQPPRLGLRGIHERVAILGGTLAVESRAGNTSLFVRVPLLNEPATAASS